MTDTRPQRERFRHEFHGHDFVIKRLAQPKPPPPPPAPVVPPARGAQGLPMLYFYTARNALVGVGDLVHYCKAEGIGAVALLTHQTTVLANADQNPPGLREELQAAGIKVVASGWLEPNVDLGEQARVAAHSAIGFDEYLANVESAWGYDGGDFFASDRLCEKLGPLLAGLPVSCSIQWGQQLHLKPWLDIGLTVVRPQCYANEWPHQTIWTGVQHALQAQHDAQLQPWQVEPTAGSYGDHRVDLWSYYGGQVQEARANGWQGCLSAWAAEFLGVPDLAFLGGYPERWKRG